MADTRHSWDYQGTSGMGRKVWRTCRLCMPTKMYTIFSQTLRGYLKNHWTNSWLVCTYLYVFCMLNSNMVRIFWTWIQGMRALALMVLCHVERVNRLQEWAIEWSLVKLTWFNDRVWFPRKFYAFTCVSH